MITAAHAKGIKVYGATITPVNGTTYYTAAHESVRAGVNKWIRTPGNFDAYIDFDHTIRNSADTTSLQAAYENDWLHPNAAGYELLGETIDLNLFVKPTAVVSKKTVDNKEFSLGQIYSNHCNGNTIIPFEIHREAFISVKVYSMLGKEIAELAGKEFTSGKHTVEFKSRNLVKGMYVYSLKVDQFVADSKMFYSALTK
jgi:hypothetical protein